MTETGKKPKAAGRALWRYVALPILVAVGVLAVLAGLIEGPALQPFLYGVF